MASDPLDPASWAPDWFRRRYALVDLLGEGATSRVYRGVQVELHRPVVVKVLCCPAGVNPRQTRFASEARVLATVDHERVVKLLDYGLDDAFAYMTYTYEHGVPVNRLCGRGSELPVPEALQLISDVLDGLAAVHARAIVHRDIKPANLLRLDGGGYKILDFGLARRLEDQRTCFTVSGQFVGTPAYASPAQVLGMDPDPRDDLYSLGVVAYEALTGANPFLAPTVPQGLERILNHRPVAPAEIVPALSPAVSFLVMDLLEKDRAHRPPTAAAARIRLRDIREPSAPARSHARARARGARDTQVIDDPPTVRGAPGRGRRPLAVGLVLAVLAGLAYAVGPSLLPVSPRPLPVPPTPSPRAAPPAVLDLAFALGAGAHVTRVRFRTDTPAGAALEMEGEPAPTAAGQPVLRHDLGLPSGGRDRFRIRLGSGVATSPAGPWYWRSATRAMADALRAEAALPASGWEKRELAPGAARIHTGRELEQRLASHRGWRVLNRVAPYVPSLAGAPAGVELLESPGVVEPARELIRQVAVVAFYARAERLALPRLLEELEPLARGRTNPPGEAVRKVTLVRGPARMTLADWLPGNLPSADGERRHRFDVVPPEEVGLAWCRARLSGFSPHTFARIQLERIDERTGARVFRQSINLFPDPRDPGRPVDAVVRLATGVTGTGRLRGELTLDHLGTSPTFPVGIVEDLSLFSCSPARSP